MNDLNRATWAEGAHMRLIGSWVGMFSAWRLELVYLDACPNLPFLLVDMHVCDRIRMLRNLNCLEMLLKMVRVFFDASQVSCLAGAEASDELVFYNSLFWVVFVERIRGIEALWRDGAELRAVLTLKSLVLVWQLWASLESMSLWMFARSGNILVLVEGLWVFITLKLKGYPTTRDARWVSTTFALILLRLFLKVLGMRQRHLILLLALTWLKIGVDLNHFLTQI